MPATYTVTTGRNQRMTFSGTKDSVEVKWMQDYYVDVTGVTPSSVSPWDVLSATGIPVVNKSVYYDGTKIIPFVVCRNKTAEQMREKLSRWIVKTEWSASRNFSQNESDNTPITPPAALTDITPRVVPILGSMEKVLYYDKALKECYRTPAYTFWTEPVMETIPTLSLQITQYEASITYEELLERLFKVNKFTYRSQPRYDWLITNIEPVEVEVQLSGGPTTAAQVTYTVAHNPELYGWKERRALIDTHYLEDLSSPTSSLVKRKPFLNELEPGSGYINNTGGRRSSQDGEPDYVIYETYDTIDFDEFLQV